MPTRSQVCTWIAAVGLLLVATPAAAQEPTERDIVELILRDGPQARAIRAETDVTRREQRARLAYPNPSVTYSREGAGFTEFVQAEQALPLFGVRAALARAGVAATAAAEAERDVRLSRLRAAAAAAVARLATEQARVAAARAQIGEVERLIEILRTREREGEGSRFDRLRAEEELRDARRVLTGAEVAVAEAGAELSGMLPREVTVSTVAATAVAAMPVHTIDALMLKATAARAELRALQHFAERARLEADAARRAQRPSPTVFGGLKRADGPGGGETGAVVGVSAALPLFDSGSRDAARWEAERARVDAERTSIESRIRGEISGARQILSVRLAALAQEPPNITNELVQIAEVAYREGDVGILELLDAVRAASRARIRAIDLRLEARLAQLALERAVGDTLWP